MQSIQRVAAFQQAGPRVFLPQVMFVSTDHTFKKVASCEKN